MARTPVVKICGVTNLNDAVACSDSEADFIGLNLWPHSPRHVTLPEAERIARTLRERKSRMKIVLVFVSPSVTELEDAITKLQPDYIQIHGLWIGPEKVANVPILRAFSVGDESDYEPIVQWRANPILIDAKVNGFHGGTGHRVNLDLIREIERDYLLAGGLTPENVAEVVRSLAPFGVDVASGVESSPGRKDHIAIREFVRAAKNA